jgi:hypothetical protein
VRAVFLAGRTIMDKGCPGFEATAGSVKCKHCKSPEVFHKQPHFDKNSPVGGKGQESTGCAASL